VENSREEQIAQLRTAIAAQETQRATLGHAIVELSLKPLRNLLDSLLAESAAAADGERKSADQDLLTQLQSYIPKQLAEKIRSSGQIEGERRQVTVVFADISGFTALSERLDPEEVASFSNDCMKELIDAVYQYEGMVDKFIGDCIMAVFGAPIALEDDAERALRATLAMRERLEGFNRKWISKLKEPLSLHIGINSGTVIAGNVGNDLRMSNGRDISVFGQTIADHCHMRQPFNYFAPANLPLLIRNVGRVKRRLRISDSFEIIDADCSGRLHEHVIEKEKQIDCIDRNFIANFSWRAGTCGRLRR
jgi:class 3 adenylate cyclase